jgi:hypothetical protein
MPTIRPLAIDPPTIGRIYAKAREHRHTAPFGMGHDPEIAARILTEPGTVVYELGEFGGILIVTDVPEAEEAGEERVARPHILIWDAACYRMADEIRAFAAQWMQERRVHRLVAEISAKNATALAFVERFGFNRVGVFRHRVQAWDGKTTDSVIFDALRSDLTER